MRFQHMPRRIFLAPALGLALAVAIAACSSSSSSSSTKPVTSPSPSPTGSAAAIAAIEANWATFFSSSTPDSKRVELLQNGSAFASAVKAFSASPMASEVTSKVTSVQLTSATEAAVKYNLTAAGQSVASGASGTAVFEDGVWKVGDSSFCGLLEEGSSILNIPVPSACK